MVLRALGLNGCSLSTLRRLCATTRPAGSIWTVDLAHLLRRFAVDVSFLTVTIGANPHFVAESFYKETMEEDRRRVNWLFERAPQAGIRIQRRSLSSEELSALILSGHYLVIALVDKRKLSHPWTEGFCLPECCGLHSGYTGHYVVLCGYDTERGEFEIRDPASGSERRRVSLDALEDARKAFGTDEDILLVSLDDFDTQRAAATLRQCEGEATSWPVGVAVAATTLRRTAPSSPFSFSLAS
eukprot:SM000005S17172  [mRNA]  locus=s5:572877:574655:- [translate_table: standard]